MTQQTWTCIDKSFGASFVAETPRKKWRPYRTDHGGVVVIFGFSQQREPSVLGAVAVLAPARHQPRRVVPLGRGSLRQGEEREQAHLPLRRLLHVPLVPRHGEGVL